MAKETKLFAPPSFWGANPEILSSVVNGCGTKGLGDWIVPDTLWGLSITKACNIHDWMYFTGKTIEDKDTADRVFLNNMVRIIENESCALLRPIRRMRAMKYYSAVRDFGGPAFWTGKNKKSELGW